MFNKKLLKLLGKDRVYLFYALGIKLFSLILNMYMIVITAQCIEDVFREQLFDKKVIYIYLFIIACKIALTKMESRTVFKLSVNVKKNLRKTLFNKVYGMGVSFSSHVDPAEVVQLGVGGIESLEAFFGYFIPQMLHSILSPFILFFFLFQIDPKISAVLLLLVPIIPLAIMLVQKLAKKVNKKYWDSYIDLSGLFLDFLEGLTTLKIYGSDESANEKLNKNSQDFRVRTMELLALQLNNITIMDLVAYIGTGLGAILSMVSFLKGTMDLKGGTIFILLSSEFFLPLRILGSLFHVAMNGIAASERLYEILETKETEDEGDCLEEDQIGLEIKGVDFDYLEDRRVLRNINMEIGPRSIVAITGKSGCGKSTIASLIMGSLQANSGSIVFNKGKRPREKERLEKCTLVGSSPYLFKGSIAYNLRMGNPQARDEEMWRVLEMLDLKSLLMESQGLDTQVEERGMNFSGGQRQRLAIARALLKGSKLYIFDEATSNIDSESEEKIMEIIKSLAKKATVVLISHSLKNAKEADYIYHLQEGSVIEEGSFESMLDLRGDFYQTYEKQTSIGLWGLE